MFSPTSANPKYIVTDKVVSGKAGQVIVGDTAITFDQTDATGKDRKPFFDPMSFGGWTLFLAVEDTKGTFRQLDIDGKYSTKSGVLIFSYADITDKPDIAVKETIYVIRFSFNSSIDSDNTIIRNVKTDQGFLSHGS